MCVAVQIATEVFNDSLKQQGGDPGSVIEAARLGSQRSRVRPTPCIEVSKEQNVSSPLTRKDSILWGAPVPEE